MCSAGVGPWLATWWRLTVRALRQRCREPRVGLPDRVRARDVARPRPTPARRPPRTDRSARRASPPPSVCLAVMTAGVAVAIVAVVALACALRGRWLAATLQVAPPAIAYATWYFTFGKSRIVAMPTDASAVPDYVKVGMSNALDHIVQWPNLGLTVALGVVVLLARRQLAPQSQLVRPIAMAVGSIVLFAINGLGRAALGTDQAKASRYVYIAAVLLLPLMLLAAAAVDGLRSRWSDPGVVAPRMGDPGQRRRVLRPTGLAALAAGCDASEDRGRRAVRLPSVG